MTGAAIEGTSLPDPPADPDRLRAMVRDSVEAKQRLLRDPARLAAIADVARLLVDRFRDGRKLLLFGNGGSAADAQHIAAEFAGRFRYDRPSLPAFALTVNPSTVTAIANDYDWASVFARQVEGSAMPGDIVVGLSTSGASVNVAQGLRRARERGAITVAMTGDLPGAVGAVADRCLRAPTVDTPRVQEVHILVGHMLAEVVERTLFPPPSQPAATAPAAAAPAVTECRVPPCHRPVGST